MGREPRLDVDQVRDRVLETGGESDPLVEGIRSSVHDKLYVERGGEQRGVLALLGRRKRLRREPGSPFGVAAVGPGPSDRYRQPRPLLAACQRVRLVKEGGDPPRIRAEGLPSGQPHRRSGHPVKVACGSCCTVGTDEAGPVDVSWTGRLGIRCR